MTIRSPLQTRIERRSARVAINAQSFLGALKLNLIGQDAMGAHAEMHAMWARALSMALRTWTNNLLQTTLAPSPPAASDLRSAGRISTRLGLGL